MKFSLFRNQLMIALLLLGLTGQYCSAAEIPPDLVGVWQFENGYAGYRMEIYENGTVTTWRTKGKKFKVKLKLIEKAKIAYVDDSRLKIDDKKKRDFSYQIKAFNAHVSKDQKETILLMTDLNNPRQKFRYSKLQFKGFYRESYEAHLSLAFSDVVEEALIQKNFLKVASQLRSPAAKFLTTKHRSTILTSTLKTEQFLLMQKIIASGDQSLIATSYKLLPDGYSYQFLAAALFANDKDLIDLLARLTGENILPVSKQDRGFLDYIFRIHTYLNPSLFQRSEFHPFGCGRSVGKVSPNGGQQLDPDVLQQRRDFKKTHFTKLSKPEYYQKFMLAEFTRCLEKSYSAPLSQKLLNSSISVEVGKRKSPKITTPLYYYGALERNVTRRQSMNDLETSKIKYIAIVALLNAGADPKIKPTKGSLPFVEYLYSTVNHRTFTQALEAQNGPENLKKDYLPIMEQIDRYNQVMRKIGGPDYIPYTVSKKNKLAEKKSTAASSTNKESNRSQTLLTKNKVPPKTLTIPNKQFPPVKDLKPTNLKAAVLIGCWKWANGAYVIIGDNGSALIKDMPPGKWKVNPSDNSKFIITWSPIVDTLTISQDGTSFSGKNQYDVPITGKRVAGNTRSLIGSWLRESGLLQKIENNGTISAAHLKGTWAALSEGNFKFLWPIVDNISFDGENKLNAENQFGSVIAIRDQSCSLR